MKKIFKKDPLARFTPEMENNFSFNFTNYIRKDMNTFLTAIHGSYLSPSKNHFSIWGEVANELFNDTKNDHDLSNKGLYDKLIMECAFKQNILKKKELDIDGGCDLFQPTLTTNGLCYSFNSKATTEVWKETDITNAFENIFPWKSQKKSTESFQASYAHKSDGKTLKNIH